MKRTIKDPLFSLPGRRGCRFSRWPGGSMRRATHKHIHLDIDALTEFVQHRSQLRDPVAARAQLDGMSEQELQFVADA